MNTENQDSETQSTDAMQPQHHDQRIRAAIASVEPPEWLKDSILQHPPKAESNILRPIFKIAALAAILTVGFVLTSTFINMKGNNQLADEKNFREAAATYIADGNFLLDYKDRSIDAISEWLQANNAPEVGSIPSGLQTQEPIGCKELTWRGDTITLVCFHLSDGNIVHMFIGNRTPETEGLFANLTDVTRVHQLETGGWQTDEHVYLLTGSDPSVSIKDYLGAIKVMAESHVMKRMHIAI